jgi:hypothetical protein
MALGKEPEYQKIDHVHNFVVVNVGSSEQWAAVFV